MKTPIIREIALRNNYSFQYEDFAVATQDCLHLLLGRDGTRLRALKFSGPSFKYGAPNDEARGGHPLFKHGSMFFGMYEVENSPWIYEQMVSNRVHPSHSDSMFAGHRHFIICLKDVTLEVTCRNFEEIELDESELISLVKSKLEELG